MMDAQKLANISAQCDQIIQMIKDRMIDPNWVAPALQDIIDRKFAMVVQGSVPSWYVSPERQLERIKRIASEQNWGFTDADFPSVPENFVPHSPTEVLLLSVYLPRSGKVEGLERTFLTLWSLVDPPAGYTKYRWNDEIYESDPKHLRLAHGEWRPGIRWVGFDSNPNRRLNFAQALRQMKKRGQTFVGTEFLMAALLFPDWVMSFRVEGTLAMFGLECYDGYLMEWRRHPLLHREEYNYSRRLYLETADTDRIWHYPWSSPVVREC